jgi:hypothetical protein
MSAAKITALGDGVIFRIEDDEGLHEVDCTVTAIEYGVLRVSPTHWLGEGHLILDRFRSELESHLMDPAVDGSASEDFAGDYINAVLAKLAGDMWAVWKEVLAK